jgi:hypothetical protein
VAAQNKAWLNKGKVPRNPGLNSRISWLAVKSVSARSLKNVPKYIHDFDFLEFSFLKYYQIKNGFLQKWIPL